MTFVDIGHHEGYFSGNESLSSIKEVIEALNSKKQKEIPFHDNIIT